MKRAFTLVELMVAVGLLALILSFAGIVFNASIETYRTAAANAEIMRKFRAITDRLDADFHGLCRDAPLMIFFRQDPNDPNQRYDQIMSFAYGDFRSYHPYDGMPLVPSATGLPIRGDFARVYYGLAWSRDPSDGLMKMPFDLRKRDRLLARRGHIFKADSDLHLWPNPADVRGTFPDDSYPPNGRGYINNETFEHDSLSLAQWKIQEPNAYGGILDTCFAVGGHACVDMGDPSTFHKLMCEGVGSFAVQWSYRDPSPNGATRWYPSADPEGTGRYSHFGLVARFQPPNNPRLVRAYTDFDVFGALFNTPHTGQVDYWLTASRMAYNEFRGPIRFPSDFFPDALKFTFTLFDSKGIIGKGRTFTHIVYLNKELSGIYQPKR